MMDTQAAIAKEQLARLYRALGVQSFEGLVERLNRQCSSTTPLRAQESAMLRNQSGSESSLCFSQVSKNV
jgi:hypothetical protein